MADQQKTEQLKNTKEIKEVRFGRYQLVSKLGRGGMGSVYKARDTKLDRIVALKTLSPGIASDELALQRFEREAKSNAKLHHPHIVTLYDFEKIDTTYFLTMDFIDGMSMDRLLKQQKLDFTRTCQLMLQVLDAIGYAHLQNIIHRDIKPGNILIDKQWIAFVTDFGLAKAVSDDSRISHAGTVIGTPCYMAPEQAQGDVNYPVDTRSDIYSLGAMMYEMLTGKTPFQGENALQILSKLLTQEIKKPSAFNPDIPPALEEICMKALAKKKEARYQSTAEMAAAISNYLAGKKAPAQTGSVKKLWWRRPAVVGTAVSILFLLLLLGILPKRRERPPQYQPDTSKTAEIKPNQAETADDALEENRKASKRYTHLVKDIAADDTLKCWDALEDFPSKYANTQTGAMVKRQLEDVEKRIYEQLKANIDYLRHPAKEPNAEKLEQMAQLRTPANQQILVKMSRRNAKLETIVKEFIALYQKAGKNVLKAEPGATSAASEEQRAREMLEKYHHGLKGSKDFTGLSDEVGRLYQESKAKQQEAQKLTKELESKYTKWLDAYNDFLHKQLSPMISKRNFVAAYHKFNEFNKQSKDFSNLAVQETIDIEKMLQELPELKKFFMQTMQRSQGQSIKLGSMQGRLVKVEEKQFKVQLTNEAYITCPLENLKVRDFLQLVPEEAKSKEVLYQLGMLLFYEEDWPLAQEYLTNAKAMGILAFPWVWQKLNEEQQSPPVAQKVEDGPTPEKPAKHGEPKALADAEWQAAKKQVQAVLEGMRTAAVRHDIGTYLRYFSTKLPREDGKRLFKWFTSPDVIGISADEPKVLPTAGKADVVLHVDLADSDSRYIGLKLAREQEQWKVYDLRLPEDLEMWKEREDRDKDGRKGKKNK